ncbi:MAG: bifunctional folylpolyglutamate synthase/dihydrofolate synthase [Peptococcaceae bacterium]|nr:bifunctional folylpolyglutamate synthase/dihydrofolate synthase [Peptococcaceae bacterium]
MKTMIPYERYEEALSYLSGLAAFGIKPGLERMEALLALMGNPQTQARFIHVGGTNGKGSTLAIMEAVLSRLGWRTGCYISPHLQNWRERIRWEGALISEEDVLRGVNLIRPLAEALEEQGFEHPTEFEVTTALAFWYFAEKGTEGSLGSGETQRAGSIVLLEVGMGGAADSTNVVNPEVVVLTSIGMDHMDYLGTTLAQIAGSKAGIIKAGRPVVASVQPDEAWQVIRAMCRERGAPLICAGVAGASGLPGQPTTGSWLFADSRVYAVPLSVPPEQREIVNRFDYHGIEVSIPGCQISLAGQHQIQNGVTALAAVEVFLRREGQQKGGQGGLTGGAPEKTYLDGLRQQVRIDVTWPGRLEVIRYVSPDKTVRVVFDGAHNEDGMKVLRQALIHGYPRRRLIFCFAMLEDKGVEASLKALLPLGDVFVMTRSPSPRAGDWRRLASLVREAGVACIEEEEIEKAMERALALCHEDDLLCVTGSLYMMARARGYVLSNTADT